MDLKEHRKKINKRWNITSSDSDEEAFRKFKQRILTTFKHAENQLTSKSVTKFCQYYAIDEQWKNINSTRLSNNIINKLNQINNIAKLCEAIEIILSLNFKDYQDRITSRTLNYRPETIQAIKEAIEISDINVAIGQSKNDIILYPKGEEKLDEELVSKTLSFLNKESNKHFEKALKFYQNKDLKDSAERLRSSLEEFLRYKLENQKGLKQNIQVLQGKLKEHESQPQIRNIIFKTFDYLDKFFNEHSKHGDNIGKAENEFLIYQTGLLMRYINTLDKLKK